MQRPKAILFDLGNVLFEIDIPGCSKRIYDLLKPDIDKDSFRNVFKEKNEELETGEITKGAFINFLLKNSRPKIQALDIILAWNSMLIGMPEHHFEMLIDLKKKYKLYILSNINAFHHARFKEMIAEDTGITNFDDFFHQCFYSHLIGHRKPHPQTFEFVLKGAGLLPGEIFYLDDTLGHLKVAEKLGFQTTLVPNISKTKTILQTLLQL